MDDPITLKCGIVNCYLVGEERFALIDTGYPGMEDRIEAAIRAASVDSGQIALIVVTHGHLDHYGSAAALRRRFRVPVACAREDAGDLEIGINRHLVPVGLSGRVAAFFARLAAFLRKGGAPSPAVVPDILFSGPVSLAPWGVDASVVPCPGHTPGSLAVIPGAFRAALWTASGDGRSEAFPWAIVADLAFGRFSSPRRARLPIFASDRAALSENLRRFSSAKTVYLGHGGPVCGEDLSLLADEAFPSLN